MTDSKIVTEKMVEAGAKAFCETLSLNPRKLAEVVYLAMRSAKPVTESLSCFEAEGLVKEARSLALAGEESPDDLGGDIVTMSLRNPDGLRLMEIITSLVQERERLNAECERAWEAYRIAHDQAMANGEAALKARLSPPKDQRQSGEDR